MMKGLLGYFTMGFAEEVGADCWGCFGGDFLSSRGLLRCWLIRCRLW